MEGERERPGGGNRDGGQRRERGGTEGNSGVGTGQEEAGFGGGREMGGKERRKANTGRRKEG